MDEINILIINRSKNALPAYATQGSSGMDLRASIEESIELKPMERMLVPTGIFLEIPEGFEAQVRPRSGLAVKHGITCLNSPGTIDSDYRGEIHALLINLSTNVFVVKPGDRVAQMVFCRICNATLINVNHIKTTLRGEGGFGHTGIL